MNTASGINTGFQLCNSSDSEGEVEDASISPTLSHAEAPELQNISCTVHNLECMIPFHKADGRKDGIG